VTIESQTVSEEKRALGESVLFLHADH
jgi:hypothetical protein